MTRQSIPPEWATLAAKAAGFDQMTVTLKTIEQVCKAHHGTGNQAKALAVIEGMANMALTRSDRVGGVQ